MISIATTRVRMEDVNPDYPISVKVGSCFVTFCVHHPIQYMVHRLLFPVMQPILKAKILTTRKNLPFNPCAMPFVAKSKLRTISFI